MLWFGSCDQYILARFLWSKNRKHSSPNHGLCCFNSYRPRVSLDEVLIFSLTFSQTLFMSSLSFQVSKAANLFEILIGYCLPTSTPLSFLRLNFSTSNVLFFLFTYCKSFPNFCNHQILISITVSNLERSYIECTRCHLLTLLQFLIPPGYNEVQKEKLL